jgi:hypothetical protein
MSRAVATNNFWATAVSPMLLPMLSTFGSQAVFGFYAAMNALALVMIFLWLSQT